MTETDAAATARRAPPPASEHELIARARALAGQTLGALAAQAGMAQPGAPRHTKGYAGTLLEFLLGADAGSRSLPDFTRLGIELKSIPVNAAGVPAESTFLCVAPLRGASGQRWEDSPVWHKLRRVLWIPLEADPRLPLAARRVGWPVLWSPDSEDARILRDDWEELTELLLAGGLDTLDARLGRYLQVRPKAANARALTPSHDAAGAPAATLPRGFYLRTRFTRRVLLAAGSASGG